MNVSTDILLGVKPTKPKKQAAKGRLQLVFEAASKLPRRQQDKVAEFVEAFVSQHNVAHVETGRKILWVAQQHAAEVEAADDVAKGGVLFALPALLGEGLLSHTREH